VVQIEFRTILVVTHAHHISPEVEPAL